MSEIEESRREGLFIIVFCIAAALVTCIASDYNVCSYGNCSFQPLQGTLFSFDGFEGDIPHEPILAFSISTNFVLCFLIFFGAYGYCRQQKVLPPLIPYEKWFFDLIFKRESTT